MSCLASIADGDGTQWLVVSDADPDTTVLIETDRWIATTDAMEMRR